MAVEETQTTNYQIAKYISTDAPNLLDQYNEAMDTIDTELLKVNTAAANAATAAANAGTAATNAQDTANEAKTTADAAATAESVANLDTTLSNEIATVNYNLISQQVNGSYSSSTYTSDNGTSLNINTANNKGYFFLSGGINLDIGTKTLVPIPGSSRYGIKLSNNPMMAQPPTAPLNYPSVGFKFKTITISSAVINVFNGTFNLIIGTDNNLYLELSNQPTYTVSDKELFRVIQSKLTLTNLNIEPIYND